jgi:hypothetical protein
VPFGAGASGRAGVSGGGRHRRSSSESPRGFWRRGRPLTDEIAFPGYPCSEERLLAATSARTPLPAISISMVKATIAPIVHITARPKVVNSTEATVASRKVPTKRVRTDAQVAAPPKAARSTAASSARDRRRRCDNCAARSAISPALAPSINFVIWSTRSATRPSRVENTFRRVAMPDNKKTGVSAT